MPAHTPPAHTLSRHPHTPYHTHTNTHRVLGGTTRHGLAAGAEPHKLPESCRVRLRQLSACVPILLARARAHTCTHAHVNADIRAHTSTEVIARTCAFTPHLHVCVCVSGRACAEHGHVSTGGMLDTTCDMHMIHDTRSQARARAHTPMLNKTPVEGQAGAQAALHLQHRLLVVGGEKERVPVPQHPPCLPLRRSQTGVVCQRHAVKHRNAGRVGHGGAEAGGEGGDRGRVATDRVDRGPCGRRCSETRRSSRRATRGAARCGWA